MKETSSRVKSRKTCRQYFKKDGSHDKIFQAEDIYHTILYDFKSNVGRLGISKKTGKVALIICYNFSMRVLISYFKHVVAVKTSKRVLLAIRYGISLLA